MVFTTGQWLGIAAFTTVVVLVGIALLKLDSMIGTNHGVDEGEVPQETAAQAAVASPTRSTSQHLRRRR
ncbi:MAG: hypothetical protein P4L93_00755 [Coriobacteriia bacterium]|nr:hypothetical protein [Coriobacteriia bacterium]